MNKLKVGIILSSVVGSAVGAHASTPTTTELPNIIHILVDDVGYDDIGCFGSEDIKTPNIDLLASKGMRFTDFYSPHGTSTPSRAALLTGRYAPRVNEGKGLTVLFPHSTEGLDSKTEVTITQLLKTKGYETALFGKWHLGHLPQYLPMEFGIDKFVGVPYPNDHGPERLGGTGIRPSGIIDPPIPLMRQTEIVKECDNNDLAELPPMFVRESCRFMYDAVKRKSPFYLQYSNIETHTPYFIPRGFEGRSEAGAYGDAVEYMDVCVGIIMDMVKRLKIESNTIIVFTSDNGPLIHKDMELEKCYGRFGETDPDREHMLRGGKYQERYDGGIRVPCIVVWQGVVPENRESSELVASFDLFNLFAQVAGVEIPSDRVIDGRDIMPLITGEKGAKSQHQAIYGFTPYGALRSVRFKDWKMVYPQNNNKSLELYDLNSDLGEKSNVADQHPDVIKKISKMGADASHAVKNDENIK